MNWVTRGSSKNVFTGDSDNDLVFEFTNRVSVFDRGPIPVDFTYLDELRCAIAVKIFEAFNESGIENHFMRKLDERHILVKACAVPEKKIKAQGGSRLLPLELLFRNKAKKNFIDRIHSGEMDKNRFKMALGSCLEPGMLFNPTFVECSTKHEASDRYITDAEAMELAALSKDELRSLYALVMKAEKCLTKLFSRSHISVDDGKFEVGISKEREFFICDSISPDELGLSDLSGRKYDKNPLREWYKITHPVWCEMLMQAKKTYPQDSSLWPEYPEVPPESLIREMVESYTIVADALGC